MRNPHQEGRKIKGKKNLVIAIRMSNVLWATVHPNAGGAVQHNPDDVFLGLANVGGEQRIQLLRYAA
jgi:hypothetical protein